jgi:O-antigen ligase
MAVTASRFGRMALPGGAVLLAAAIGWLAGREPGLAVGAALAVAFTLITLADLYVGLVLFTVLTFAVEIPELGGSAVSFSKLAGLLLGISWLAVVTTRDEERSTFPAAHPIVSYTMVLFLSWIALSQLWAEDAGEVREVLLRLALNGVLVVVIFTAVRKPRHAIGVASAFVAGATLNAIYGLLFVEPEGTAESARLASGIANPNELATILVAALVLALGLAAALRSAPFARVVLVAAAGVCTAGVFLTGSRGGLVALGVALIAFLLIGSRFRGRILIVAIAIAASGIGYYDYVASPEARARITDVEAGSGRTDLWEIGWRMVETETAHGVGGGNFKSVSSQFLLEPGAIERTEFFISSSPKVTHNSYLEIWAELGVVGLALFLAILGFGLYAAGRATRAFARLRDARMEVLSRTVFVAFAAVLAADFFGSRQYDKELWFMLGLAAALWAIARRQEAERAE